MLTHQDFSELQSSVASEASEGGLFALIDHAAMPGLTKKLTEMDARWVSLFDGSRDEGALTVAPILISIESTLDSFRRKALLRWIGERGTYNSSMLFMNSSRSMPELARRLALRLDATLSDETEIVLRYFDARVFEQLISILSDEQKSTFLNVASCWWFVDRYGNLRRVDGSWAEVDGPDIPLVLSTIQEGALLDASEPDQVAELLCNNVPDEYACLAPGGNFEFILRQMTVARNFGVQSTHDHALYCSLALLESEDFAEQEKWISALEGFKTGKYSFNEAIRRAEINE